MTITAKNVLSSSNNRRSYPCQFWSHSDSYALFNPLKLLRVLGTKKRTCCDTLIGVAQDIVQIDSNDAIGDVVF